jgi:hypothetical protein
MLILGKRTLVPILNTLVSIQTISEYIYSLYKEDLESLCREWYISQSPIQFTSSCGRKLTKTKLGWIDERLFLQYFTVEKERLHKSIRLLSDPYFLTSCQRPLTSLCKSITLQSFMNHPYNREGHYHTNRRALILEDIPIEELEILLNCERVKLSSREKVAMYNKIVKKYSQSLQDNFILVHEEGDVPYDVPIHYPHIHDILWEQYECFRDMNHLWEPGIIMDSSKELYTY